MRINYKKPKKLTAIRLTLTAFALVATCASALAEADGPDYFRVSGVKAGDVLNLRAQPSGDAMKVGEIPPGGDGVKNLGCRGGLSFAEWQKATPAQKLAAQKTRWCRVSWRGVEGWAAARFLVEGAAPR